jgi:hypothetical protein
MFSVYEKGELLGPRGGPDSMNTIIGNTTDAFAGEIRADGA